MEQPSPQVLNGAADTGGSTVITCFSPDSAAEDFAAWSSQLHVAASEAQGFTAGSVGLIADSGFDWSIASTFDTEQNLHAWLDGPKRRRLLADGRTRGFAPAGRDILVAEGRTSGTGILVFRHSVSAGKEGDFLEAQRRLVALSATFSGFEGATLIPTGNQSWLSALRFRTDQQLQAWLDSTERDEALSTLRPQLSEGFTVVTGRTPFGSVVRVEDGITTTTPTWKSAMLVLLVLYPTVMTLSRFLGPVLDGAAIPPWLSMWLSQIASVGLMSFLFMPAVTGWFHRWLDPVEGAGRRVTSIGVLVIVAIYLATLALFGSVTWLQFWAHPE